MLDSTITLALPNGGTPINEIYTRIDQVGNRSLYHGSGHSAVLRKTLGFYRTLPKKSGNFLGVMKGATKVTIDQTVVNAVGDPIVAPSIAEMSFSIPIGVTESEFDAILDRLEAQVEGQRSILKRLLFGPEV